MTTDANRGIVHDPAPLAIVDVDYGGTTAKAACVVAERWTDRMPSETHVVDIPTVQPYAPGRFFERELPCLLAVLPRVHADIEAIVVDGYVVLDEHGAPGLGAHLHAHYRGRFAVVGVAKTPFRDAEFATPVLRGTSKRPLWVTAIGLDVADAVRLVTSMHGPHRIPTLLGWVDRLAAGDPPPFPVGAS
jgi:deoxyribonuclease V